MEFAGLIAPLTGAAAGFLTSAVTAIAGYMALRRKRSGVVSTTDADALWAESGSMRRDLQTEIARLREEIQQERHERERLLALIDQLRTELDAERAAGRRLQGENTRLEVRVAELEDELRSRRDAATKAAKAIEGTGGGGGL